MLAMFAFGFAALLAAQPFSLKVLDTRSSLLIHPTTHHSPFAQAKPDSRWGRTLVEGTVRA
eukprot:3299133-Pleurochrysis_carterae.AAC.1